MEGNLYPMSHRRLPIEVRLSSGDASERGRRYAYLVIPYSAYPYRRDSDPQRHNEWAEDLFHFVTVAKQRGAQGWIVDLRGNTGGYLGPMLAGLQSLLGNGNVLTLRGPGSKNRLSIKDGAVLNRAGFGRVVCGSTMLRRSKSRTKRRRRLSSFWIKEHRAQANRWRSHSRDERGRSFLESVRLVSRIQEHIGISPMAQCCPSCPNAFTTGAATIIRKASSQRHGFRIRRESQKFLTILPFSVRRNGFHTCLGARHLLLSRGRHRESDGGALRRCGRRVRADRRSSRSCRGSARSPGRAGCGLGPACRASSLCRDR